jgi:hypothetical protein
VISQINAFTREVDDEEIAAREILKQLDLEHNAKKNSVGVVYFYQEFYHNGIIDALR